MPSATTDAPTPSAKPTSDVGRKVVQSQQGRADRGELELDAQPDLRRLGEPGGRRTHRLGPETRQRLERDDPAISEVEDRLELDVDVVAVEHGAHARPLQPALLAFELPAIDVIRNDLREHVQEARVTVVERGLGGPAEATQRSVEGSVPEPDGRSDVGADPRLAGQRKTGGALVVRSVLNQVGELALNHSAAVRLLGRDPC